MLGTYIQSGASGLTRTTLGKGSIFSLGFQYGYSYSRSTMPIVPPNYGRREMHPVVLLKQTPVAAWAGPCPDLPLAPIRGVEFARFGRHLVAVNHRSSPVDLGGLRARNSWDQISTAPGWLAAHSATCLEL